MRHQGPSGTSMHAGDTLSAQTQLTPPWRQCGAPLEEAPATEVRKKQKHTKSELVNRIH